MGIVAGCRQPREKSGGFPRQPIKVIVPFAAGGGSDTFGRILQRAIGERGLLSQPLVIINVPGAGGTIGSRRVKNASPDGYTLLLLHEGIMTSRHAGNATYGPEAFVPIAGTGDATQVIVVGETSPFRDLPSLLHAAAEQPDSIVFAANIGAPSHFAGLMLESKMPGAKFRYTQTGGGAKRFASIQGGHVDVSAFSIAEYWQFRSSGLRALALLGPERHHELPELPTAAEQGIEVVSQNMQFWWAPLGTPAERVEAIANALVAAMQTGEVRAKLSEMKITNIAIRGSRLRDEIRERERQIAAVAPSAGIELPDFVAIALGGLSLTGALALVQHFRRHRRVPLGASRKENGSSDVAPAGVVKPVVTAGVVTAGISDSRPPTHRARLLGAVAMTTGYVLSLQFQWLGFVPTTAIYVLAIGSLMARDAVRRVRFSRLTVISSLVLTGFLMSVVMHYLLTQVLVVDLP